jgi:hypothetical protein
VEWFGAGEGERLLGWEGARFFDGSVGLVRSWIRLWEVLVKQADLVCHLVCLYCLMMILRIGGSECIWPFIPVRKWVGLHEQRNKSGSIW